MLISMDVSVVGSADVEEEVKAGGCEKYVVFYEAHGGMTRSAASESSPHLATYRTLFFVPAIKSSRLYFNIFS